MTRKSVEFVIAVLGVVLVAITPNPPVTVRDWAQIVGGASLTAYLTTRAGREESEREHPHVGAVLRWLRQRWARVLAFLLLVVVVAVGVPPLSALLRGAYASVAGCPPATQLRMVAEPETIVTARSLAADYERSTAAENYGCPTVRLYVFDATSDTLAQRLSEPDGWSDVKGALNQIGPRPDVWLATSGHELDALAPGSAASPIADRIPIGRSPMVLAVPATAPPRSGTWSEIFRGLTDDDVSVVRPDPRSTVLGPLATALLYGEDANPGPSPLPALETERRLDAARQRSGFPRGDGADLLCHQRRLVADAAGRPAATAIITSEQQLALYNSGAPLGGSCIGTAAPKEADQRLVGVYPDDTATQDVELARLAWSDPVQQQAAAAFGAWLRGDDGLGAVAGTGLRPAGPFSPADPLVTENGVDPNEAKAAEPLTPERWSRAADAFDTAQQPSRVLFLFDTSGSMNAQDPNGRRWEVAGAAVRANLPRLGPRDQFGLWFFSAGRPGGHDEAVALGPNDAGRVDAAGRALGDLDATGGTPLFQAMIDGARAVAAAENKGINALVVLTDGEDSASGISADETAGIVDETGVRVDVVPLGGLRCADGGLPKIVNRTDGRCAALDPATDPAALHRTVSQIVDELKGRS